MNKKYIIIGAGFYGEIALRYIKEENVYCFADNSCEKIGTEYYSKPIIPIATLYKFVNKYRFLLALKNYQEVEEQLRKIGIDKKAYEIFDIHDPWCVYGSLEMSQIKMKECFYQAYGTNEYPHNYIEKLSKFDFIEYPHLVIEYEKANEVFLTAKTFYNKENYATYGYINALLNYSGLNENLENNAFFCYPAVFHGVDYGIMKNIEYNLILCGYKYKKKQKANKCHPVFSVGPYIRYAKQFYSEVDILSKKSVLGRTLLVIPMHSYLKVQANFDIKLFTDYVFDEAKSFDSVLVCLYHMDYGSIMRQLFESRGAKIVCAGLITDIAFVKRLKTIFTLSDAVITNGLGAHIPFALEEKKPIKVFSQVLSLDATQLGQKNSEIIKEHHKCYVDIENPLTTSFISKEYQITAEQLSVHDAYAGFSITKTPQQMRAIFLVSEFIMKESDFDLSRYYIALKSIYKELMNSRVEQDKLMFSELKIALPNNFLELLV